MDNDLPLNIEEVDLAIKNIESLISDKDFDFSYSNLKKVFLENLKTLPIMVIPEFGRQQYFYRVISTEHLQGRPDLVNDCMFPPKDKTILSRANLAGFPVMYCSLTKHTAIKEKKVNGAPLKEGEELFLSIWQLKSNHTFNFAQYIFDQETRLGDLLSDFNSSRLVKLNEITKSLESGQKEAFRKVITYLAQKFIDKDYRISAFIRHFQLYDLKVNKEMKPEAILYPSIAEGMNGLNIAFHPKTVIDKLELVEVHHIGLDKYEDNGILSNPIALGLMKKDKIQWNGHLGVNFKSIVLDEVKCIFDRPFPSINATDVVYFVNGSKIILDDELLKLLGEKHFSETIDFLGKVISEDVLNKQFRKELPVDFSGNNVYALYDKEKYYLKKAICSFSYRLI